MRAHFSLWIAASLLNTALAQDLSGPPGFIRFVNATGFDQPVFFKLNNEQINPDGYRSGQATGAIGFTTASYSLELEHATLGKDRVQIQLRPGELKTVIALPKTEKAKDGEEPKITLTQYVLDSTPSAPGRDPSLTLLQITPLDTLDLTVAGTAFALKRLKPDSMSVTKQMGEFPAVEFQSKKVCTLNYHDPQDQVVVFFTDGRGALRHVSFNNNIQ